MAFRIKLATLFSFIATIFLVLTQLAFNYSELNFSEIVGIIPKETFKYLACFILIALVNYFIAGYIVRPLTQMINRLDISDDSTSNDSTNLDGDELLILEQGILNTTTRLSDELRKKDQDMDALFESTVSALAKAVYARDPYTGTHSENVMRYARAISVKLQLSEEDMYYLEIGALLHDIGKIGVPEHVLMKPGKLTDMEFAAIQKHPEYGYQIINEIEELRQRGVHNTILHHHERMDGKGYPKGLKGDDIPIHARIVSVCDAFDAMTTTRSYRPALQVDQAVEQLKSCAGVQFDAYIVDVFIQCLQEDPSLCSLQTEVAPSAADLQASSL